MLLTLVTVLTGYAKYYYGKPDAQTWDWSADHMACLREVGVLSQNGQYAMVYPGPYRACMLGRGWKREEKIDPPWRKMSRRMRQQASEICESPS